MCRAWKVWREIVEGEEHGVAFVYDLILLVSNLLQNAWKCYWKVLL